MVYLPLLTITVNPPWISPLNPPGYLIMSTWWFSMPAPGHWSSIAIQSRPWAMEKFDKGDLQPMLILCWSIYIYMISMFYVFFTEMMKYDNCDCCWEKSNQLCFFRSKWLISFDMYPKSSNTRIEKILVERISKQNTDSHMKRQQTDHTLLASHTQTFCFCSRNPWLINQKNCSE